MAQEIWTNIVPVISTTHMPHSEALEEIDRLVADTPEGGFVYIGLPEYEVGREDWLGPIAAWAWERFGEECTWIRFDRDGDEVDGLPTFEW